MRSFKLGAVALMFALFATLGATSAFACEGNPNCDHSKKSLTKASDTKCVDCDENCTKCADKKAKAKEDDCDSCDSDKKEAPKNAPAMKCAPGKCG